MNTFTLPRTAPETEPFTDGAYFSFLVWLIDLGSRPNPNGRTSRLCRAVFELEDGRRIQATYTQSLGTMSRFRQHWESWRGKPFTDDELVEFDPRRCLGLPARILVQTKPRKDGGGRYANIINIIPAPADRKHERYDGAPLFLWLTPDGFDRAVFDRLPPRLKAEIQATPEYQALVLSGLA